MKQLGLTELFHYVVHFGLDAVVGEVANAAEVGVTDSAMGLVVAVLDFHTNFLVGIPEWQSFENQTVYVFYCEDVVVATIFENIVFNSDFPKHICSHTKTLDKF